MKKCGLILLAFAIWLGPSAMADYQFSREISSAHTNLVETDRKLNPITSDIKAHITMNQRFVSDHPSSFTLELETPALCKKAPCPSIKNSFQFQIRRHSQSAELCQSTVYVAETSGLDLHRYGFLSLRVIDHSTRLCEATPFKWEVILENSSGQSTIFGGNPSPL